MAGALKIRHLNCAQITTMKLGSQALACVGLFHPPPLCRPSVG